MISLCVHKLRLNKLAYNLVKWSSSSFIISSNLKSSPLVLVLKPYSTKRPNQFRWEKLQWGVFLTFAGLVIGGSAYFWQDLEHSKKVKTKSYGRPTIGGDFKLVDHNNKPWNLVDYRGSWILIYFGFCRCPDICPEQLERLVEIYDRLMLTENLKRPLLPVFITVDAERDTPDVISQYVKEFSPDLIGLTGTKEQVDQVAKLYRIYYSAGPKDDEGDYIVDHTIVMYLINPNGEFSDYYGQAKPVQEVVRHILERMHQFETS